MINKESLMCADFRINCLSCWRARRLTQTHLSQYSVLCVSDWRERVCPAVEFDGVRRQEYSVVGRCREEDSQQRS